jgi:hypothetical protein
MRMCIHYDSVCVRMFVFCVSVYKPAHVCACKLLCACVHMRALIPAFLRVHACTCDLCNGVRRSVACQFTQINSKTGMGHTPFETSHTD